MIAYYGTVMGSSNFSTSEGSRGSQITGQYVQSSLLKQRWGMATDFARGILLLLRGLLSTMSYLRGTASMSSKGFEWGAVYHIYTYVSVAVEDPET